VVDFHARLLKDALVETADARPTAWTEAAVIADDRVAEELRAFLAGQLSTSDHVIIKDPRLIWFLPLWRRVAGDLGVTPRFITMLRHPAAVVDSKQRFYGSWKGDVSRAAGWINTMLYTERATREGLRTFVRYEDVLEDWTKVVNRTAERLDLSPVIDATALQIRAADSFVDPALRRSAASWDGMQMPTPLREQADHVWDLLSRLADNDAAGSDDDAAAELDSARDEYVALYQDAEAVAQSSIIAGAKKAQRKKAQPALSRLIPHRVRRRIPARLRSAARVMSGRSRRR
jgi:hypothetical protein